MADLLKRNLAPLTAEAWEEIDEQAVQILKAQLTARTLVDFSGPHGWEKGAVNLGGLEIADSTPDGVPWGMRTVAALIEVRIPFVLHQLEMDNISRGAKDADLGPLEEAAGKLARFEEDAIYNGFKPGKIEGIVGGSEHKPVTLPKDSDQYHHAIAEAVKNLRCAGVGGPYSLVLGMEEYAAMIQSGKGGYPPRRLIRDTLQGEILQSPPVRGGVLVSTRGGDFEFISGQDVSIGYAAQDRETVELFITESFSFRVLEPKAAVALKPAK